MNKIFITAIAGITLLCAAPADAATSDNAARTAAARKVAEQFIQRLGGALKHELQKDDQTAAIKVCSNLAPSIASELSRGHGWRVTRVGTRVRNPMPGMPDVWEQQALERFAKRLANGEKPGKMEYAAVVEEPDGKYFRYMKAIGVKPACLMCHGSPESMPDAIRTALDRAIPARSGARLRGGRSARCDQHQTATCTISRSLTAGERAAHGMSAGDPEAPVCRRTPYLLEVEAVLVVLAASTLSSQPPALISCPA